MSMTPQQASALAAADACVVALTEAHRVLRASLADPVPPVEPPALGPTLIEARGSKHYSQNWELPADFIDTSKLPPVAQPWTLFADDDQRRTIAPSMNGVLPTAYETLHVFGNMNVLYQGTPALVDGKKVSLYTEASTHPMLNIMPILRKFPLRGGPRGVATMNPYTAWHGHEKFGLNADGTINEALISVSKLQPWWVGVVMDGHVTFAMRDGSVSYPYKIPLKSYANDFCFYRPDPSLQFVVDSDVGEILKVQHKLLGLPASHDLTFTTEVFATGFGVATSIRAIGEKLYIADNKGGSAWDVGGRGGAVWELDAVTKVRRKVCDLPHAFWIDATSNGQLLVACTNGSTHLVDPATGRFGPSFTPSSAAAIYTFVSVSVDRNGTLGPVDAWTWISSTGGGNISFHRFTSTGQAINAPKGGLGRMTVGDTRYCADPTGHYPWVAEHHPYDGCILVQGFANFQPTVIAAVHPTLHKRPVGAKPDITMASRGEGLMLTGGKRLDGTDAPSFTCLMSTQGWGLLGCTADYIAEMSYADAAAFVRRGMIGSVPRLLTADEVRSLLYWLYYNSQRHLREGASLINGLLAANLG